jgi:tRNA(fMet)-specific endonuclease VapC
LNGYLLDTNACIEYFRRRNSHVLRRLQVVDPSELFLCPVVLGELYYGAFRSGNAARNIDLLLRFISLVNYAPYDQTSAEQYGRVRAELQQRGTPIGPHDTQIAAIALVQGLTVVTHNTAEFSRVSGLSIEDWQV